jgi:hypothetical protein
MRLQFQLRVNYAQINLRKIQMLYFLGFPVAFMRNKQPESELIKVMYQNTISKKFERIILASPDTNFDGCVY